MEKNYVGALLFFENIEYIYSYQDMVCVICSVKDYCIVNNKKIKHISENTLINIVNFFVHKNIVPTYEMLLDDNLFSEEYDYMNFKLLILLNKNLIQTCTIQ